MAISAPSACERVDVRVDAAPADDIAAGRRARSPDRSARAAARRAGSRPGSRRHSSSSSSCVATSAAWTRTSFAPVQSASAPTCAQERQHRVHVADARDVRRADRLRREHAGGEDRQGGVLVPGGRTRPAERLPSLDHERLLSARLQRRSARRKYVTPVEPTRDARLGNADASTRRARRCCGMRSASRPACGWYARDFGEDEELWRRGRPAARLRLRDPPHARQASAGRRADPAGARAIPRSSSRPFSRTPSTWRCRATRR